MPLNAGEKLGPYEIVAPLGAGGMGEVYRARDTKLDREVAIKVLPEALAHDPARLVRFEREAKVLASLNHPNIAQIYGLEDRALVMELVPGETLGSLIKPGPLPVETALNYARQIAEALEAAHEKGIVHRDLKPANIMVTPEGVLKVLDFGLAAISTRATPESGAPQDSPTLTIRATQTGMIMGTAAYMSPEQARGQPVDKRADIWAFGVVLYEMAAGKRLFDGATTSDLLAAILKEEPDLTRAPEKMRRLLAICLEKDPRKRLRDIGDAMYLLATPRNSEAPSAAGATRWWRAAAIVAACAALLLAGLYFARKPPPPAETARFQIHLPDNVTYTHSGSVTLSPDGRHAAISAITNGKRSDVWVQDFDADVARELPNTVTSSEPPPFFWSPDSRFVVFSGGPKLRKSDIARGVIEDICDKPGSPIGGSWSKDGVIIFGSTNTGLWRVPAAGGKAVPLTTLDEARQEKQHELPQSLPDGKHFIYLATSAKPENAGIFVGSLDDPPGYRGRTRILATGFGAQYVASPQGGMGYLLFLRGETVMAQPFDLSRMQLQGEASPVTGNVGFVYQTPYFSATPQRLAFRLSTPPQAYQLTWLDRDGKPGAKTSETGDILDLAVSPDDTRVAYQKRSANRSESDIWILDLVRDTTTRFTFGPDQVQTPIWSPDGAELAYAAYHGGHWTIYRKPVNGARDEEVFLKAPQHARPLSWSRDGRFLLYSASEKNGFGREDMWVLPLTGERKPFPFAVSRFEQTDGQFSPDGRFIAYASDETGHSEVYVRTFSSDPGSAASGGKWRVSPDGGFSPQWRADGKELSYISTRPYKQMSVSIDAGRDFRAGNPAVRFDYPYGEAGGVAASDLKRYLVEVPVEQKTPQAFTVLLNWASMLKTM